MGQTLSICRKNGADWIQSAQTKAGGSGASGSHFSRSSEPRWLGLTKGSCRALINAERFSNLPATFQSQLDQTTRILYEMPATTFYCFLSIEVYDMCPPFSSHSFCQNLFIDFCSDWMNFDPVFFLLWMYTVFYCFMVNMVIVN